MREKRKAFFSILIVLLFCCKKEISRKEPPEAGGKTAAEFTIDAKKLGAEIKIAFEIIKTETVGYVPRHKFYWVCLSNGLNKEKVEELASAIIKETIAARPRTYHSFTIHFFRKSGLGGVIERSRAFARATYLPEGSWLKVGKIPINDYKDYTLTCTFLD